MEPVSGSAGDTVGKPIISIIVLGWPGTAFLVHQSPNGNITSEWHVPQPHFLVIGSRETPEKQTYDNVIITLPFLSDLFYYWNWSGE